MRLGACLTRWSCGLALAAGGLAGGCGSEFVAGGGASGGSAGQGATGATGGGGAATTSTTGGGGTPTTTTASGAGGVGGSEPGPECDVADVSVAHDTVILPGAGDCNGSIHYGYYAYGNIGAGRALLRFVMPEAVALRLGGSGAWIADLALTISRDVGCIAPANCPAHSGTLVAYPMRSDWDEGNVGSGSAEEYGGADWCRRVAGISGAQWGAPGAEGAADRGLESGSVAVNAVQPSAHWALDAALHQPWLEMSATECLLSVQLVAAEQAVFVAAMRENDNEPGAVLHIRACSPATD